MPRAPERTNGQMSRDQAKSIQRWTRTYARNRTLGGVVNVLIFVLLSALIALASSVSAHAYVSAKFVLLVLGVAIDALSIAVLIWLSVPCWGGRLGAQLAAQFYANEGQVSLKPEQRGGRSNADIAVGIAFGACVLATILVGYWLQVSIKYMQPISAIYCVPFMVYQYLRGRPWSGPAMLIWPCLYALHALLIVTGVPIVWNGHWMGLNMLVPVAGYGILAGLAGHVHSRIALRRLRTLTGPFDESEPTPEEIGNHE